MSALKFVPLPSGKGCAISDSTGRKLGFSYQYEGGSISFTSYGSPAPLDDRCVEFVFKVSRAELLKQMESAQ